MFAEQSVVSLMQSYAMIVDKPSNINLAHQSIVMFGMIEFEAKCFHFCRCEVFWFSMYCFTIAKGAPPTVDTK